MENFDTRCLTLDTRRESSVKNQESISVWFLVISFQLLFVFVLCGCTAVAVPYLLSNLPEKHLYDATPSDRYDKIILKESGALNVLPMIYKPEFNELLSQSRSVVASSGQSEDGYRTWFNMVAFDENKLTAKRKYFFSVDDMVTNPGLVTEPKRGLVFYSQTALETEILRKARAYENAGKIAILRYVLKNLRKDIDELGRGSNTRCPDSKNLFVSGLLINQVFGTILYTLNNSPAQAAILNEESGVEFDHINFGKGKIQMFDEGGIITVKIRMGAFIKHMPKEKKQQPPAKEVKSAESSNNQQKRAGL